MKLEAIAIDMNRQLEDWQIQLLDIRMYFGIIS